VVELTGLERMVVLIKHVLRRKPLLLTNSKPQLQLQHRLLLMLLQPVLPVCRQLQIFGILQLNMQVELQVRTSTLLPAVQTSVKKITEQVNKDLFSNPNVTLLMRRQKQNSGQRSEHHSTLQSAVAECLMPRNF
jgi:hypothetical protein